MIAALSPECRVSSMAHEVAFGHVPGSGRVRIVAEDLGKSPLDGVHGGFRE